MSSFTEKTNASRMPIQNAGSASPIWLSPDTTTAEAWRWRTAAKIPTGTAINSASTIPTRTRLNVTPSRGWICGHTWSLVTYDVPRSPVKRSLIHDPYCEVSGRSVPSWCRSWWTAAGVACVPRSVVAGSPGIQAQTAKITTDATASVSTRKPRRRARLRAIGALSGRGEVERQRHGVDRYPGHVFLTDHQIRQQE